MDQLVGLGLLRETTGGERNRLYRHGPYLALFELPVPLAGTGATESGAMQTTGTDERQT